MLWYDSRARDHFIKFSTWDTLKSWTGDEKTSAFNDLKSLQISIVGSVVLPGDPDYDQARMLSNPRFSAFPAIIVYCEVDSDVATCLSWARMRKLPVVVRSGGHSTGGFSAQNGFLIDVSRLNDVVVDVSERTVWAGPGTTFRKFNAKIEAFGLHTPGGACPDVCVGGYMQGGGYGFTARIFGMNCDQVIAVRVMLADGRMVYADATTNRDLFWAVRGGTGSNFGVLMGVKYRLYEGEKFSGFSIVWSLADNAAAENAAKALSWLQKNFMRAHAPPDVGYQMIWAFEGPQPTGKQPVMMMRGMYRGSHENLQAILHPVLALPGATLQALYNSQPYSSLNKMLLTEPYEVPDFPPNMTPMPPPEAKLSRYIDRELAPEEWLKLLQYFLTSASPYTIAAMEIYGGAIESQPALGNAFIHRAVYCDLFLDVFWSNEAEQAEMLRYIEGWSQLIAPFWSGFVYQNYPSPVDLEFGTHYWGAVYPLLGMVKLKYDPDAVFSYPQSIVPVVDPTWKDHDIGLSDPIECEPSW
ncbi:FAD-binding protein [Rhizobium sp. CFBP 8762]|uniref:FAD-dependent oxidoreductase n=1 Tax=Rhizobium sp. CFBP 8762 TaxID=2775279 RepID=UPI00177ED6F4|nr:FAD-dependent oxidoreductase [Rhizobium sp. CFBP 8762]MBD8555097.1 FAD-binding protein [Rhizobium sp. CFBP 8762]